MKRKIRPSFRISDLDLVMRSLKKMEPKRTDRALDIMESIEGGRWPRKHEHYLIGIDNFGIPMFEHKKKWRRR